MTRSECSRSVLVEPLGVTFGALVGKAFTVVILICTTADEIDDPDASTGTCAPCHPQRLASVGRLLPLLLLELNPAEHP
jgi:hypothetical protein